MLRIFAFDLDGTILGAGGLICNEAKEALSQATKLGTKLVMVTGRAFEGVEKILDKNNLSPKSNFPHAIIANEHNIYLLRNGSYVPLNSWNEYMQKKFIYFLPLTREILSKMKQELEYLGLKSEWIPQCEEQIKREAIGLAFSSAKKGEIAQKYISHRLSSFTFELLCTRNTEAIQLIYKEGGKGRALLELTRFWRIRPFEVLAVGNSQHDEDMLDGRYGFRSATVSNAEESIKEAVLHNKGYVAKFSLGQGVAEILVKEMRSLDSGIEVKNSLSK